MKPGLWSRLRGYLHFLRHLGRHHAALQQRLDAQQSAYTDLQQRLDAQQSAYTDLQQQQGSLTDQLQQIQHRLQDITQRQDQQASEHQANVDWLQGVWPDLVAAIGRKIELEQLQQYNEQLCAALLRELQAAAAPATLATAPAAPAAAIPATPASAAEAGLYLALEQDFRGSRASVAERQSPYLAHLRELPAGLPLLDLGCGRGEWLQLLRTHAIPAVGVDHNPINGLACRTAGLEVVTADILQDLANRPAASLAAITAFQLVEHLPFEVLQELLRQARRLLAPGGRLILETPNPENLQVATHSFWLDPTHIKPIPPAQL